MSSVSPEAVPPGPATADTVAKPTTAPSPDADADRAAVNYASRALGATVASVSHESAQLASAADNVLADRDDLVWIAGAPPQHVTVSLPAHPGLQYIGWYVWQDYLTNPKRVEVSSGPSQHALSPLMTCTALPGPGVQLWQLPAPGIPAGHTALRLRITETFGGTYTYMNRVFAFAEHPGQAFIDQPRGVPPPASLSPAMAYSAHAAHVAPRYVSPPRQAVAAGVEAGGQQDAAGPTSPLQMTSLLRELDDDIRALHPLHASTQRLLDTSRASAAATSRVPLSGVGTPVHQSPAMDRAGPLRVSSLEAEVATLLRAVESQRDEIDQIKALLVQQARGGGMHPSYGSRQPSPSTSVPRSGTPPPAARGRVVPAAPQELGAAAPFPDAALRDYIEDVMAPKLTKHARRFEARMLRHMDEHVAGLRRDIDAAIEESVTRHIAKIAEVSGHNTGAYRRIIAPETVTRTERRVPQRSQHRPPSDTSSSGHGPRHRTAGATRESARVSPRRTVAARTTTTTTATAAPRAHAYRDPQPAAVESRHRSPPRDHLVRSTASTSAGAAAAADALVEAITRQSLDTRGGPSTRQGGGHVGRYDDSGSSTDYSSSSSLTDPYERRDRSPPRPYRPVEHAGGAHHPGRVRIPESGGYTAGYRY